MPSQGIRRKKVTACDLIFIFCAQCLANQPTATPTTSNNSGADQTASRWFVDKPRIHPICGPKRDRHHIRIHHCSAVPVGPLFSIYTDSVCKRLCCEATAVALDAPLGCVPRELHRRGSTETHPVDRLHTRHTFRSILTHCGYLSTEGHRRHQKST